MDNKIQLKQPTPKEQPTGDRGSSGKGGGAKPAPAKPASPPPARLVSLDAYRGLIMTMLAANAFGIYAFTQIDAASPLWGRHDHGFWQQVGFHFEHPEWESKFGLMGISFWDLIQPAFMFMVGVAMPFSYRRRESQGQKSWTRHIHAFIRALVLVLLGVFLSSTDRPQTNWIFPNVLCQIGLGYLFTYALLGCRWYWQTTAITAILVGYWALFYFNPPNPDYDFAAVLTEYPTVIDHVEDVEVPGAIEGDATTEGEAEPDASIDGNAASSDAEPTAADEEVAIVEEVEEEAEPEPGVIYEGRFRPWSKNGNIAHRVDVQLLNWFPRPDERVGNRDDEDENGRFLYNRGGYQTLNFVPSIATMLLGVLCGQILLIGSWGAWKKIGILILLGGVCFGLSLAAELVCPVVKRIWTPSWVLFSGAYVIWGLAAFYMLFDALPFKWLAFPLVVVGMNSILMYMMGQLIGSWTIRQVHIHFGIPITTVLGANALNDMMYQPIVDSTAKFLVFWLIAYWLYRQRYFLRI